MSIYITNKTYSLYSQYKPDKIWASETFSFRRYQPFSIKNIKGSCEAAMFGPKNTMFILKILILPVYILT